VRGGGKLHPDPTAGRVLARPQGAFWRSSEVGFSAFFEQADLYFAGSGSSISVSRSLAIDLVVRGVRGRSVPEMNVR
jgi:hypothetical protein